MTIDQLLRAIKAHRGLVFLSILVTVLIATGIGLLMPKTYKATASVVLDVKSVDPIVGTILPQMASPSYMSTQVDIFQSDRVARRVVDKLKLEQDAETRRQWQSETDGNGSIKTWIAQSLLDNLTVKPGKESNVIELEYQTNSARLASTVVNAFAQAYIDTSIDLRVQPARSYAVFFDERLNAAKDNVRQAQERISEYQRNNGLVIVTDERLDIENARLAELSTTLTTIQALRTESQSKAQMVQQQAVLSDAINHPLINTLRSDAATKESRLQDLAGRLGENHPEYQRALAELSAVKKAIEQESGRVNDSLLTANKVNVQREGSIRQAIEGQKARILKLKADRDAAASLQRDLDTAQRQLEQVSLRGTQSELESRSNQTNISVLTEATEPFKHSAPKIPLIILLSLFVGALLGVGAAILRELSDRRIRAVDDFNDLQLSVLGVMSTERPVVRKLSWFRKRFLLKHTLSGSSS